LTRKKKTNEKTMEEGEPATLADLSNLEEGFEMQTARRSDFYRLLATAFAFPSEELTRAVAAGEVRGALDEAAAGLPYTLDYGRSVPGLSEAGPEDDALEVDYIRLFDVGPGSGPPCPLYTGNWTGDRLRAMEECLRFYEHFGLGLPDPRPDLPDHLCIALEFLHYLSFRQVEAQKDGETGDDYIRAQRDFLDRQVLSWFPRMASKLTGHSPQPFYDALVACALAFFEAEKAYLKELAQRASS